MIQHLIFGLALLACSAHAAPTVKTTVAGEEPRITLHTQGGFLLNAGDPEVNKTWNHDALYSYLLGVGAYYNISSPYQGLWMFGGGDIAYFMNEEELNGNQGNAFVSSTFFQLMATAGFGFAPPEWRGFGLTFAGSLELWGQKSTDLSAAGFTADLGTESTELPWLVRLNMFYAIDRQWRPFIGYEYRTVSSIITFGIGYGI